MTLTSTPDTPKIFTVGELTRKVKSLLEVSYPFIWIIGEISNCSRPSSGHIYFTLKDEVAQIRAVMFRGQNRRLRFRLEDGMRITGLGRLSVYEARGTYQVIFEHLEPEGVGAIQQAFEELKSRLAAEGLFADERKRPLPLLPRGLTLITSPSGAVVHDFVRIATRRFRNLRIHILPVRVQGRGAAEEIAAALAAAASIEDAEVVILARGGGSLEDLQAFNSEVLARAIFDCRIPVVSAVGHETDFTIADFVADLRAPTPSAAAELVVPERDILTQRIADARRRMVARLHELVERQRSRIESQSRRLSDPRRRLCDLRLRVDDFAQRNVRAVTQRMHHERQRLRWQREHLASLSPLRQLQYSKETLDVLSKNILKSMEIFIYKHREDIHRQRSRLDALNPRAILARGYSITRTLPDTRIVTDPAQVEADQLIEILLSRGELRARTVAAPEPAAGRSQPDSKV